MATRTPGTTARTGRLDRVRRQPPGNHRPGSLRPRPRLAARAGLCQPGRRAGCGRRCAAPPPAAQLRGGGQRRHAGPGHRGTAGPRPGGLNAHAPGRCHTPARGAYAELNDLIALRFPARQLELGRRNRALSALAGPNKSNFRGRGIDFEEVRSYQPGDDIRTIDWRVTARTGSAHTKLFREERERPVLVVVDQRSSMFFGSSHCFKSVLAAQLASLLAWSALDAGDRVGGLVFNEAGHREIRPRRSRKTVLALLSQLPRTTAPCPWTRRRRRQFRRHAVQPATHCPARQQPVPDQRLSRRRRRAAPGSTCSSWPSTRRSPHWPAPTRMESELPRAGTYAVTDGHERSELHTADRSSRHATATVRTQREQLSQGPVAPGDSPAAGPTDQAPFALLQQYYGDSRR